MATSYDNMDPDQIIRDQIDDQIDRDELAFTDVVRLEKRMWRDRMLLEKLKGANKNESKPAESNQIDGDEQSRRKRWPRPKTGSSSTCSRWWTCARPKGSCTGSCLKRAGPLAARRRTSASGGRTRWALSTTPRPHWPKPRPGPAWALVPRGGAWARCRICMSCRSCKIERWADSSRPCYNAPQRRFPFEKGLPPPWWPTGDEAWWGVQEDYAKAQDPPPHRKPHGLKKAWKLSLLAAVIKHMSPNLNQMSRLVWQSKKLQNKKSARESETWCRVVNQEEALTSTEKISPFSSLCNADYGGGGGGGGGRGGRGKRKGEFRDKEKEKWPRNHDLNEEPRAGDWIPREDQRLTSEFMASHGAKNVEEEPVEEEIVEDMDMAFETAEMDRDSGLLVHGEEEDLWSFGLS